MRTLSEIDRRYGVQWRFDTARYTVAFWAEEEDLSPADSLTDDRDIALASDGDPAHWFCAFVGVFDASGACIGRDVLGGCSYGSFAEFYKSHRWQYSRRQGCWITNPRSQAWKACEARRPRRPDGSRMDGGYFVNMVRQAISDARTTLGARRDGNVCAA